MIEYGRYHGSLVSNLNSILKPPTNSVVSCYYWLGLSWRLIVSVVYCYHRHSLGFHGHQHLEAFHQFSSTAHMTSFYSRSTELKNPTANNYCRSCYAVAIDFLCLTSRYQATQHPVAHNYSIWCRIRVVRGPWSPFSSDPWVKLVSPDVDKY